MSIHEAEKILSELKNHQPMSHPQAIHRVRVKIMARWFTVLVVGSCFPFGIWWALLGNQWLEDFNRWAVLGLAIGGGLALTSAWMAKRSKGVDAQWGYAPLNEEEMEQLIDLASQDKNLSEVLDIWSGYCAQAKGTFRGRDWLFFKPRAERYLLLKNQVK